MIFKLRLKKSKISYICRRVGDCKEEKERFISREIIT